MSTTISGKQTVASLTELVVSLSTQLDEVKQAHEESRELISKLRDYTVENRKYLRVAHEQVVQATRPTDKQVKYFTDLQAKKGTSYDQPSDRAEMGKLINALKRLPDAAVDTQVNDSDDLDIDFDDVTPDIDKLALTF